MKFEMQVMDIFHLSSGMTALSGKIHGAEMLIPHCVCDLVLDGEVRQRIAFDGEMHVKKLDAENVLRALSTRENIALTVAEAQSGQWLIRGEWYAQ